MLTSEILELLIGLTLFISFFSLCFCLHIVYTSRESWVRTLEAVGLLGVSFVVVYASLHVSAFSTADPTLWKFSLLGASMAYIVFNVLTFPTEQG
jgi:lipid-A-disaccharide synthase-like uncharacterized protein